MERLTRRQARELSASSVGLIFDAAGCSRDWVATGYMLDDGMIHNFALEGHNQSVSVLMIPLLVIDVYEHAYMIDFGTAKNPYFDVLWRNTNWSVVEDRIGKWIIPLGQTA